MSRPVVSWLLVVASAALGACAPPPPPPRSGRLASPAPPPASRPRPVLAPKPSTLAPVVVHGGQRLRVLWGRVTTGKNCFTFSGPPEAQARQVLGGDAVLELRGAALAVHFGALRFTGTLRASEARLTRRGRYSYQNAVWTTVEQLVLRRGAKKDVGTGLPLWSGRYSYEECDTSGREGCPGRCSIEALLQLESPR